LAGCVCVVDIVQSTLATAKMVSSKDIRKYYSIFINTLIGGDLFRLFKSIPSLTSDYDFRPAGEFSVGMKYSYPLYYINNNVNRPLITNFNQLSDLRPTGAGIIQTDKLAKVMIVDDDQDIMFTFKTILKSHGINVDAYTKSIDAMSRFESHPHQYDLIILDIRMPILNGLQLYSMMRGIDRDIKILFVSALDASEELISLLPGINIENILKKPVESNFLISTVKKMTNSCI